MPFKPGQSGNPNGRPRVRLPDGRSLSDVAKEHTPAALRALVSILRDKQSPAAARVQAATALLDRGWGRPHQSVSAELTGTMSMADQVRRGIEFARQQREIEEAEALDPQNSRSVN